MLLAGFGLAVLLIAFSLFDGRAARRRRVATPAPPPEADSRADVPLIAVLIPARNEAAVIGEVIATVGAQSGVRVQLRVIDDGSTDDTAARAGVALAAGAPSAAADVAVIDAGALPAGWVGKTHALARGLAAADAPWILTLDADVTLAPDALLRAVTYAEHMQLDALSLSPSQESCGALIDAIQAAAYELLDRLYPFAETSRPESAHAAASGAFFLVRREALRAAGGFEAVRNEVVEDLQLARVLRLHGARQAFLPAGPLVRVHMYQSFGDVVRGWTRLLAPLVTHSASPTSVAREASRGACRALAAPAIAAILAQALHTHATTIAVASAAVLAAWLALHPRGMRAALLEPLGFGMLAALLVRSALSNRRGGGIEWKGRVYAVAN